MQTRSDNIDVDASSARGMSYYPLCWGSALGLEGDTSGSYKAKSISKHRVISAQTIASAGKRPTDQANQKMSILWRNTNICHQF